MSSTMDRLRRLHSLRPQKSQPELTYTPIDDDGEPLAARPAPARGRLEALVPGQEIENAAGHCYVSTTAVPLGETRGGFNLSQAIGAAPATLAPFHPDLALDAIDDLASAAFVDTETTGLGGGAGVYAFMVGVGTFEAWDEEVAIDNGQSSIVKHVPGNPTHFVVRQFFMRHPGEEAALLAAVAGVVNGKRLAVTFNGRGFDLPLLRTRYRQNRPLLPERERSVALFEEGHPHLDLLLPARRLWRKRLQSCRLINLEQMVLGLHRSEDDVPGALIPQLYVDYMRTQQAGEMQRVFYHNREDIVSMVALAHQLVEAYAAPLDDGCELYAEDLLSLAACHLRCGDEALAERAYRLAVKTAEADGTRAEIFAQLSGLLKRQARWSEAADLWQLWLSSVPGADATPFVELAKYCEWQIGDLEQAEMWAAWALHNVEAAPVYQRVPGQLADLQHRLSRIRRKRAGGNGSQGATGRRG
jgi:uncharacterized protein YprB with RNaseH-like and TPR domain